MKPTTQSEGSTETRRNQILDIALALFAERGVENVTIKDLAAEAKIAQGLIYYYFKSKDELLIAVFDRHQPIEKFEALIKDMATLPLKDGLRLFMHQLAILMIEKQPLFRLRAREFLSPRSGRDTDIITFRGTLIAGLSAYFEQRIAAGEVKPHQYLLTINMLVGSLLSLMLMGQPLTPFVPQLVDTILDGIKTA